MSSIFQVHLQGRTAVLLLFIRAANTYASTSQFFRFLTAAFSHCLLYQGRTECVAMLQSRCSTALTGITVRHHIAVYCIFVFHAFFMFLWSRFPVTAPSSTIPHPVHLPSHYFQTFGAWSSRSSCSQTGSFLASSPSVRADACMVHLWIWSPLARDACPILHAAAPGWRLVPFATPVSEPFVDVVHPPEALLFCSPPHCWALRTSWCSYWKLVLAFVQANSCGLPSTATTCRTLVRQCSFHAACQLFLRIHRLRLPFTPSAAKSSMANKALVLERDGSILSFYTLRRFLISIFQNIHCILFFALIPSFAAASMIVLQEIWHFLFGLLELPPDVTHLPTLRIRRGAAQSPRAACLKASRVCRDAAVPLYIAGLTLLKLLSADSTRCFGDAQQQWQSLCLQGTFSVDDAVAVVLPRSHLLPEVAAAREPWFYADDATLALADIAQDDVLDGEWCPWCGCACQTTLGHFHTHMQSDCQDTAETCDLARASLLAGQAARWPHSPGPAVLRNCMQRAPSPHHICKRNAFCQNLLHVIYCAMLQFFYECFCFTDARGLRLRCQIASASWPSM